MAQNANSCHGSCETCYTFQDCTSWPINYDFTKTGEVDIDSTTVDIGKLIHSHRINYAGKSWCYQIFTKFKIYEVIIDLSLQYYKELYKKMLVVVWITNALLYYQILVI